MARFECKLSPDDMLEADAPAGQVFGDEYLMVKDQYQGRLGAQRRPMVASAAVARVVSAAYPAAVTGSRVELG